MPEGPEIRRAADRIAKVLQNKTVEEVSFGLPRLNRYEQALSGSRVTAVDTRGKAMLTRFDNGLTLFSHNQLYGRWYVMSRPRMPQTSRALRVALHTDTHSALLYSASDIHVLTSPELERLPFLQRLGPDILDRNVTVDVVVDRLQARAFRRRALGSLYLDQSFLAGNGNYLRSEILWAARVQPRTRPCELSAPALTRVARETLRVSRRSYRTRGVTVPDRLARTLKTQGARFEAYRFMVFGREGLPCRECGTGIERTTMTSRNLFHCPGCQPA